jgi:hypothetical protein
LTSDEADCAAPFGSCFGYLKTIKNLSHPPSLPLLSYPMINDKIIGDVEANSVIGSGVERVEPVVQGLHLAGPSH